MKLNDKVLRWLFPALIAISFSVNYAGIFDRKMDNNGDNYYYFMLAQNLAEGKGYVTDIGLEPVPHTHFPPGYPAFMSLFMHIFPDNAVAMKVLNGLLLLLSLLLLYHILVRTAPKYGRFVALASCLLCTLHPDLLRWSTIIMSEMLYLTVSLGIIAIFLALDWESLAKKRTGQILLVALLCAFVFCTYFIRTIGISVVLALMAALAVVSATRKKVLPLVVCGLVALSLFAAHESWSIRNNRAVPGYKSDYLKTFKYDGSGKEMATLEQWNNRIGTNLKNFVYFFIPQSVIHPIRILEHPIDLPQPKWYDFVLGIAVIALILTGLATLKGIGWLLVFYVLITFAVLMVYPEEYGGTRYFIPMLPLMIAGLVSGVCTVTGLILNAFRNHRISWLQPSLLGVLLVLLGFSYARDQWFYRGEASDNYSKFSPTFATVDEFRKASEFFSDYPEDILVAVVKPEIFYFHSNRHHAVGIPRQGTPEDVIEDLFHKKADYVIIDHYFKSAYRVIIPAVMKYPSYFQLVQLYGDEKDGMTAVYKFLP